MNGSTLIIYRCFQTASNWRLQPDTRSKDSWMGHFAFVHVETFGDRTNPEVPTYAVTPTANGFQADYLSTVSNYPKHLEHLNPPGFKWRRLFDVFLPFTAKLSVFFPKDGRLNILNAACPVLA